MKKIAKKEMLLRGVIINTNKNKGENMKKYILIYKSNNRNLKIEFVNDTLLDFVNDLERFKSKNMIYNDQILELKEVA